MNVSLKKPMKISAKFSAFLTIALVVSLPSISTGTDCDKAYALFSKGRFSDKRYSMKYYLEAINLCPGFIRPYELIGNMKRKKGETEKAIEFFINAAELGSANHKLYYLLASMLYEKGDLDMAHRYLNKSLSIKSDYTKAISLKMKMEGASDTTGPIVKLYEPPSYKGTKLSYKNEIMTVRGMVTDLSGVAYIKINNQEGVIEKDGRFLLDIPLRVGLNNIEIEASDKTGNRSRLSVTVERETAPKIVAALSAEEKKAEMERKKRLEAEKERQKKIEAELAEQKEMEARIARQKELEAEEAGLARKKALKAIKAKKQKLMIELAKAKVQEAEILKQAAAAMSPIDAGRPGTSNRFYRKSFAVVVGINGYEKWPVLEFGVADAKAVKARLEQEGFDDIMVILDRQATQRRILTALFDQLPKKVQRDDRVVFYFAGHGQTHDPPGGGKQGYIIPVEAGIDDYTSTGISMDQIRDLSSRIAAKHILYIMDSCYSGLGFSRGIGISIKLDGYLRKVASMRVVQMMTAGGKGEQVAERAGHGLFTWFFLNALDGKADLNRDNVITGTELGAYLRPAVSAASNHAQTPLVGRLEGEGEFLFFIKEK